MALVTSRSGHGTKFIYFGSAEFMHEFGEISVAWIAMITSATAKYVYWNLQIYNNVYLRQAQGMRLEG